MGFGVEACLMPEGERSKTLLSASRLFTRLARGGADRHSVVCALGGGVLGDVAGFVAATYMRGIPLVQIPTSLLAMVDSSVGGKTAVNHKLGKNLIGAFYPPRAVFTDTTLLQSLPEREYLCGLSEIVKAGVIGDTELFQFIEDTLRRYASAKKPSSPHSLSSLLLSKYGWYKRTPPNGVCVPF